MSSLAQNVIDLQARRTQEMQAAADLRTFMSELKSNLSAARGSLQQAESDIKTINFQKAQARSIAEMTTASESLETAKRTHADAALLIHNLEDALAGLPEKISNAEVKVAGTIRELWTTHGQLLVDEVTSTPEYLSLRQSIIKAFVCTTRGAMGGDFGTFLRNMFRDNQMTPDIEPATKEAILSSLHTEFDL